MNMTVLAETYILQAALRIAQNVDGDLESFRLAIVQKLRDDPAFLEAARAVPEDVLEKLMRAAKVLCDVRAGRL